MGVYDHRNRRAKENISGQETMIPVRQAEARLPLPDQNLRIPGPTPVSEEVLAALAQPMSNQRGPEFAAILLRITARLQYFFQTASSVLTFPASRTGGMECALVNLFSPGEHIVAPARDRFHAKIRPRRDDIT